MTTDHNSLAGPVFAACASKGPGGESPFRASFEKGLRDEFHAFGAPAEAADCVLANCAPHCPRRPSSMRCSTARLQDDEQGLRLGDDGHRGLRQGQHRIAPDHPPPKHTYTIRPLH